LLKSELHAKISNDDAGYSKKASDNASQHVLDIHRLPPQSFGLALFERLDRHRTIAYFWLNPLLTRP